MTTPSDIVNQALDTMGSETVIGDIEDGTREAQVMLRHYGQCLRQLLRAAHWDFARKETPLVPLADAMGGAYELQPGMAPLGTSVPGGFRFAYAYPDDCVKARSVPAFKPGLAGIPNGNVSLPPLPISSVLAPAPVWGRRQPSARFIVGTYLNAPPTIGQGIDLVQGVSPQGRSAVFTDVHHATLIYTALMLYPESWDALFRSAFVSYLASETVLAIMKDKKLGLALRREQIAITKSKIEAARVADGNEGTTTTDHEADWMRARYPGRAAHGLWFGEDYDRLGFGDGSIC